MTTQTLYFTVTGQRIRYGGRSPAPVGDTVGHLLAGFNLDAAWSGLEVMVHFRRREGSIAVKLDESRVCDIPEAILAFPARTFMVGLVGRDGGGKRLTTDEVEVHIDRSCYRPGKTPPPPPPDVYAELMEAATNASAIARQLRADADAGMFDGTSGQSGMLPVVGAPYAAEIELEAATETRIGVLVGPLSLTLGEATIEQLGFSVEWVAVIEQGEAAQDVVLPVIEWELGIAPTFAAGSCTEIRLWYSGGILRGIWL